MALRCVASCASALVLAGCGGEPAPPLSALALDRARVAVIGFSSGAAMAQQVHLAYSDRLIGAVLLAGPPYQCAANSLDTALSSCLKPAVAPDAAVLAGRVVARAADGRLAPLAGLAGDRVVAWHGRGDTLVGADVARASLAVYEALPVAASMQLMWDGSAEFAHVWPTPGSGGDCTKTAPPYYARCGRDLAGEAVSALYGPAARAVAEDARGTLHVFDQQALARDDEDPHVGERGLVYVPPQCEAGTRCGLAIVFHGCEQHFDAIGDGFARDAGFNRWADVHDLVVLYPQTRASYLPLNPKACWDWWGYSGADYDTRRGAQLRWLARAAAALGAPLD